MILHAISGRQSKALRTIVATLTLAMAGVSAAHATTMEVAHEQGSTTVTVNPKKTVVYDLAALDTLHTLGIDASAVPTTLLPDFLNRYTDDQRFPKVGTLFEPDYEAVHAHNPDLIIVAGRSAPKFGDLSRLAPTIDLTVEPENLINSVKRNTQTLASLYNKQEQASKHLAQLDSSIDALQRKAESSGTGMIILTVGGKMSAYGPGSRFGVLHDEFGIKPAVQDLSTSNHGQAVSFEFIYKNDPDWLFVIDRDAAIGNDGMSARRLLDNELMHKTKAWKQDQVVYLDSMNWYLLGAAGLTSLQEAVNEVDAALDGQP